MNPVRVMSLVKKSLFQVMHCQRKLSWKRKILKEIRRREKTMVVSYLNGEYPIGLDKQKFSG